MQVALIRDVGHLHCTWAIRWQPLSLYLTIYHRIIQALQNTEFQCLLFQCCQLCGESNTRLKLSLIQWSSHISWYRTKWILGGLHALVAVKKWKCWGENSVSVKEPWRSMQMKAMESCLEGSSRATWWPQWVGTFTAKMPMVVLNLVLDH